MSTMPTVITELRSQLASGPSRRILWATLLIGLLTLGGKIFGMLKETMIAASFGTGDVLDAFLIAFLLPSYVMNIIDSSLKAALIPTHIETREREGIESAQRLFSSTVAISTLLLTLATLALAVAGSWVIPWLCTGFSAEKSELTLRLFYLLLPAIPLFSVVTNWEALLNAHESFGVAAFAPGLVSLGVVIGLGLFGGGMGIYALVIGTGLGLFLQLGMLGWAMKRQGGHLWPRWYGFDPNLRRVMSQYLPMIAGSLLVCSTVLIDQVMAGLLAPGSVAALNYGNKLVSLVTGLCTMALGTAVLPYFSQMVAQRDWTGVRQTLKTYVRLILLVTIPVTCLGLVLSTPIIRLLFERGEFRPEDTVLVSRIQSMLLLQLPFYSLAILFVRMISSLKANQILMWGTVLSFALNVGLNYVLMRWMGVVGIALSTTIVYVVSCAFLATMLQRRLACESGS